MLGKPPAAGSSLNGKHCNLDHWLQSMLQTLDRRGELCIPAALALAACSISRRIHVLVESVCGAAVIFIFPPFTILLVCVNGRDSCSMGTTLPFCRRRNPRKTKMSNSHSAYFTMTLQQYHNAIVLVKQRIWSFFFVCITGKDPRHHTYTGRHCRRAAIYICGRLVCAQTKKIRDFESETTRQKTRRHVSPSTTQDARSEKDPTRHSSIATCNSSNDKKRVLLLRCCSTPSFAYQCLDLCIKVSLFSESSCLYDVYFRRQRRWGEIHPTRCKSHTIQSTRHSIGWHSGYRWLWNTSCIK